MILLTAALLAGHTLALHVKLPGSIDPRDVTLTVLIHTPEKYRMTSLLSRKLSESDVTLPNLAPGMYQLVLDGRAPLEHLSTIVTMENNDRELEIAVSPYRLQGTAKIGQTPLAEATLNFTDSSGWKAELPIRDGVFNATMWQSGGMLGLIKAKGISEFSDSPRLGTDPSVWDIVLNERRIAGRIFDAETKQPLNGLLGIRTRNEILSSNTSAVTRDGMYSVRAATHGKYELDVQVSGYADESATFEVADTDEGTRTHDFALRRCVTTMLQIVSATGQPVADAFVGEGLRGDGSANRYYRTDAAGWLALQVPPGGTRTLYIMPREGSFAVTRVSAARDSRPVKVVVPPAAGALTLTIKVPSPKPGFIATVIRYNGEILPYYVQVALEAPSFPAGKWRLERLPVGVFEVWAVQMPPSTGYEALVGHVPQTPPVRVGVSAGESVAEVIAQPLQ
jgi:hypothetical protein